MSNEKIKHLSDKQRDRSGNPIRDAIKRAQQHVRNAGVDDLEEPRGFVSGDMKRFLENPDEHEKGEDGGR